MIGDDHDAVVLAKFFQFGTLHLQVVLAPFSDEREVRIVVANRCPLFLQQFDDGKSGRFAQIVDIFLVGHAEDKDASSVNRFLMLVQRAADGGEHVIRHVGVDFSCQFNKTCSEVPFLGFP